MRKALISKSTETPSYLSKYTVDLKEIDKDLLTQQMSTGRFMVIDASSISEKAFKSFYSLAFRYRYKLYCTNNAIDIIPDYIDTSILETVSVAEELEPSPISLDSYKRIIHIGDIHGCYDVLMEAWAGNYSPDNFYIFCGDYINRGKHSIEVIRFLLDIYRQDNVVLLEGNHDTSLWFWAINNVELTTRAFQDTMAELDKSDIKKSSIVDLFSVVKDSFHYTRKFHSVLVCHGGLPAFPERMLLVNTSDYIHSPCRDYDDIDKLFSESRKEPSIFQIHGHSNFFNKKAMTSPGSINLEGGVEYGGKLRIATLTDRGFTFDYYKNSESVMRNFFII